MSREDDTIVPGERIGPFRIGATESEILAQLGGGSVHREQREDTQVVHWADFSFWFDGGQLTQVGAHGSFGGKALGGIGIGSTLADLSREGNLGLDLEDGVVLLEDIEGICFDVGEGLPELSRMFLGEISEKGDEQGFELDANWSITWIGVFDPQRVADAEEAELEA